MEVEVFPWVLSECPQCPGPGGVTELSPPIPFCWKCWIILPGLGRDCHGSDCKNGRIWDLRGVCSGSVKCHFGMWGSGYTLNFYVLVWAGSQCCQSVDELFLARAEVWDHGSSPEPQSRTLDPVCLLVSNLACP